jgi:hypothetical protein
VRSLIGHEQIEGPAPVAVDESDGLACEFLGQINERCVGCVDSDGPGGIRVEVLRLAGQKPEELVEAVVRGRSSRDNYSVFGSCSSWGEFAKIAYFPDVVAVAQRVAE